jgi:hypothetical protein
VEKLCVHHEAGDVPEAILFVNKATETKWSQRAMQLAKAICFPEGRVRFLDENGEPGAPLQGQAVMYFGADVPSFRRAWCPFGKLWCANASSGGDDLLFPPGNPQGSAEP